MLGQNCLFSTLVFPLLEVADFGPQVLIRILKESKEQGHILPLIESGVEFYISSLKCLDIWKHSFICQLWLALMLSCMPHPLSTFLFPDSLQLGLKGWVGVK